MSPRKSISAKDFSVGLILALRREGQTVIDASPRRLHAAYEAAYQAIQKGASDEGLPLHFTVIVDEHHGLSGDAQRMLAYVIDAGFIAEDALEQQFRITISERAAKIHFITVPGSPALYKKAAQAFLAHAS